MKSHQPSDHFIYAKVAETSDTLDKLQLLQAAQAMVGKPVFLNGEQVGCIVGSAIKHGALSTELQASLKIDCPELSARLVAELHATPSFGVSSLSPCNSRMDLSLDSSAPPA